MGQLAWLRSVTFCKVQVLIANVRNVLLVWRPCGPRCRNVPDLTRPTSGQRERKQFGFRTALEVANQQLRAARGNVVNYWTIERCGHELCLATGHRNLSNFEVRTDELREIKARSICGCRC